MLKTLSLLFGRYLRLHNTACHSIPKDCVGLLLIDSLKILPLILPNMAGGTLFEDNYRGPFHYLSSSTRGISNTVHKLIIMHLS
jgi:hypothetical protein